VTTRLANVVSSSTNSATSPSTTGDGASPVASVHRLGSIEVARGLASGWVLLFHSLAAWPADALHPVLRALQRFTQHGWLGVHVFFAISGWCIAERLAAAHRRSEPAGAFLRERALRIFPTYWAALAILVVVRLAALPFNHAPLAQSLPVTARGWVGDLLLVNPYLGVPPTLLVSWSLVYELGFYALGAAALVLGRRSFRPAMLVALGAVLCLWPLAGLNLRAAYVLGLWPDFFVGALVWWCARTASSARFAAGVIGLAALAGLTAFWPGGFGGAGRFAALVTAALLWIFSRHDRIMRASAPLRALASVGVFSYSLYLIHLTVLSPFMNLAQRHIPATGGRFVAVWLAGVGLALAAGWILHRAVEAPVERWRKRRWNKRPIPLAPAP
jgi:exopolysaccharide production protein ExoZ